MQELRERGIYKLPDGREFIAHAVFRGGYALYTPTAWEFFGLYTFDSDKTGRISSNGRTTGLKIENLIDTSRTASARSKSGAVQKQYFD